MTLIVNNCGVSLFLSRVVFITEDGERNFLFHFLASDDGPAGIVSLVLLAYSLEDEVHSVLFLFDVDPFFLCWFSTEIRTTISNRLLFVFLMFDCLLSGCGRDVSFSHFSPDDFFSARSFARDEVTLIGEDGHRRVAGRQPDTRTSRLFSRRQSCFYFTFKRKKKKIII